MARSPDLTRRSNPAYRLYNYCPGLFNMMRGILTRVPARLLEIQIVDKGYIWRKAVT